jgi:hypothetical protein
MATCSGRYRLVLGEVRRFVGGGQPSEGATRQAETQLPELSPGPRPTAGGPNAGTAESQR